MMKIKYLYLLLSLLGLMVPMSQFFMFLTKYGLNTHYFLELLAANSVSRFVTLDLVIASLVFFVLVTAEGKRKHMKNLWIYFLCAICIGLSFSFPLFLYARELKSELN